MILIRFLILLLFGLCSAQIRDGARLNLISNKVEALEKIVTSLENTISKLEKKIDTKDLKEDVATLLEKSTELTERVEALEKPVGAQNSASACQENRIQIELLQPHGK